MTSNKTFDYDVIIVGGGPAGVSCAITVAQAGYSVVIVDKKAHNTIGDKTCGDAVDKAALSRLEEGIGLNFPNGDEVSDPIERMSIAAGSLETKVTLVAPGFVVDRHIFGQRLLNEAVKLGVTVISSAPVREIIIEEIDGNKYLQGIRYLKDGVKVQLRGKFTIDASGAYAVIRKQLPQEFLDRGIVNELTDEEQWPSYREIIKLNDSVKPHDFRNEIVLLYKDDFAPPGYFWIFTKGDGSLNCGIGWMKYQSKDLGSLKKGFLKEMNQYYTQDQYTVLKTGGGQIPVRPPFDSLVFNGGALAGDAACMVHPVTAEGHGPALDTAMNLGKAIINALKSNDRKAEAIWDYNVSVAHHYAKKHSQALIMRDFMEDVGASNVKYLIEKEIFKNEELDLIFSGDELTLSFFDKLKRGVKLLLKPKLLISLGKIFSGMDKCEEVFNMYPSDPLKLNEWRELRNKKLGFNL